MPIAALFIAVLPWFWLLPDHFLPWLTAWQEGSALALAGIAALVWRGRVAVSPWWLAAITLALTSVAAQAALGTLAFRGDAVMVALYLLALLVAMGVGAGLAEPRDDHRWCALDLFALGILTAAAAAALVGVMQWTGVNAGPLPVLPLLTGERPYGNLAQANQHCSTLFLGLCALGWLYERRHLGQLGLAVVGLLLICGMVMSGSRTGVLQLSTLTALFAWRARNTPTGVLQWPAVAIALAAYSVLWAIWPLLNSELGRVAHRAGAEQIDAGLRIPMWSVFVDAVTRRPVWGYGWQQVSAAQIEVALDHPPLQRWFEYAHNLPLDILLWAGVPVGAGIIVLAAGGLLRAGRNSIAGVAIWWFAAVSGLAVHALLEYPLTYAYLLVPFGVMLGALHTLGDGTLSPRSVTLVPAVTRALGALLLAVLGMVAIDYQQAQASHRQLRLQSVGIGLDGAADPVPSLHTLDHLQAYLAFAREQARPAMSAAELEAFRRVARRFPHPPVLLRVALAEGLNGEPRQAERWLATLCAIHIQVRCDEGRASWMQLQARFHTLADVAFPVTPAALKTVR